jgi:hypothetical protein
MTLIRVYIPTKDKNRLLIDENNREKVFNWTKEFISRKFGGYTAISAFGGWMNAKNEFIEEKVDILEFHAILNDKVNKGIESIKNLGNALKIDLNQESVFIQIIENETALFI